MNEYGCSIVLDDMVAKMVQTQGINLTDLAIIVGEKLSQWVDITGRERILDAIRQNLKIAHPKPPPSQTSPGFPQSLSPAKGRCSC